MRVALVGCGQIARAHIGALASLDGLTLVGVCDRDEQRARQAAAWAPGSRPYTDHESMLRTERPDAVHILTPPATHATLAIAAIEAGCHVLVEKPMALSLGDADRMIAAASARGVMLGTNHNYRHKPSISKAERLVAAGAIGRVVHVNAYYGVSAEADEMANAGGNHWAYRLPGGVFTDYLPHLIYLQMALLPGLSGVAGVTAGRGNGPDRPATELSVLLQGEGAVGTMTVSLLARPYAKFVEIYGTKGVIHADLVREVCLLRRVWRAPGMVSKVLYSLEDSAQRAVGTATNALNVALGRMPRMPELPISIGQFYARIREGQEPPAPGTEGRRMIALMEEVWAKAPDLAAPSARPTAIAPVPSTPRTAVERRVAQEGIVPGRVLVTGATGYLGRHLVASLVRCGAEVVAVVRDRSRVSRELERQTTVVEADLRDTDALAAAMEDVDAVFHCAAVTRNNVPWEVHQATNIDGTRAVFAAALRAGVGRVIHISSIVVYGLDAPPAGQAIDETACYARDDDRWAHYLISKREADKLAFAFHREDGLPVTVIRPGVIYGPGGGRTVGRGLAEVGPLRLSIGAGRNALPFTYIDNLVDALLLAVVTPEAVGQAYNIVDNPAVPVRDYVAAGASMAHEHVVVLPVPPAVLSGVAGALEGRQRRAGSEIPPRLSRFVVRSATSDIRYDATKAARELGWQPAVDWREGISRSLNGAA